MVLLLVVLLLFGFTDAIMYMVLCFGSNMRMIVDAVDKRAMQDQVSCGLTHMGCSGCLMFVG